MPAPLSDPPVGPTPRPRAEPLRRLALLAAAVIGTLSLSAALGACGSSTPSTIQPASDQTPLPAGPVPSEIATMVCAAKAQSEVNQVLGVTATVTVRTWVNHRYSCPYTYPTGSFQLSVQELSSWGQTLTFFHGLGHQMGVARPLYNLGQGAFQATDGAVVVRKDWKVLIVDPTKLPAQFGVPPTSRSDVAVTVADVILGCWDGD